MATTVVFSGGPAQPTGVAHASAALATLAGPPELVIAADSGLMCCLALGVTPDVVVGDMDSVSPHALAEARAAGARIQAHPRDKDAVDLELALDLALSEMSTEAPADGPHRLVVIGSPDGRLDHLVASMALLGAQRFAGLQVDGYLGSQHVAPVHHSRSLTAPVGTVLSVLPLHGPGTRVTLTGVRWPLEDHELDLASSLGVSNEFARSTARIDVSGPPATVILPGNTGTDTDADTNTDSDNPGPDDSGPHRSAPGGGANG